MCRVKNEFQLILTILFLPSRHCYVGINMFTMIRNSLHSRDAVGDRRDEKRGGEDRFDVCPWVDRRQGIELEALTFTRSSGITLRCLFLEHRFV